MNRNLPIFNAVVAAVLKELQNGADSRYSTLAKHFTINDVFDIITKEERAEYRTLQRTSALNHVAWLVEGKLDALAAIENKIQNVKSDKLIENESVSTPKKKRTKKKRNQNPNSREEPNPCSVSEQKPQNLPPEIDQSDDQLVHGLEGTTKDEHHCELESTSENESDHCLEVDQTVEQPDQLVHGLNGEAKSERHCELEPKPESESEHSLEQEMNVECSGENEEDLQEHLPPELTIEKSTTAESNRQEQHPIVANEGGSVAVDQDIDRQERVATEKERDIAEDGFRTVSSQTERKLNSAQTKFFKIMSERTSIQPQVDPILDHFQNALEEQAHRQSAQLSSVLENMESQRREQQAEIQKVRAQMESERRGFVERLESQRRDHQTQMESQRCDHQTQMESQRCDHQTQMESQRREQQAEIQNVRTQMESERRGFVERLESQRGENERVIGKLRAEIKTLDVKISRLNNQMYVAECASTMANAVNILCQRLNNFKEALIRGFQGNTDMFSSPPHWGVMVEDVKFKAYCERVFAHMDGYKHDVKYLALLSETAMGMRRRFDHDIESDSYDTKAAVKFAWGVDPDMKEDNIMAAFSPIAAMEQHINTYGQDDQWQAHVTVETFLSRITPWNTMSRSFDLRNAQRDAVKAMMRHIESLKIDMKSLDTEAT